MSTGSGSGGSDPEDAAEARPEGLDDSLDAPLEVSREEFEQLVDEALDSIPEEIAELIRNVVVLVEDEAPADDPDLLGRYDGLALTERPANHTGFLPDRIELFREPLTSICRSREELAEEIAVTVVHEVAHHFGLDEQRIHDLGFG